MDVESIDHAVLVALLADERTWLVHGGSPGSFRRSHLPGAVCFADLGQAIRILPRGALVVVYGAHAEDERGRRFAEELRAHGFPHVRWYREGIAGWRAAGGAPEGGAGAGDPDPP